jgi:hypothetical protein
MCPPSACPDRNVRRQSEHWCSFSSFSCAVPLDDASSLGAAAAGGFRWLVVSPQASKEVPRDSIASDELSRASSQEQGTMGRRVHRPNGRVMGGVWVN